jgi:hypothetical protein
MRIGAVMILGLHLIGNPMVGISGLRKQTRLNEAVTNGQARD